MRSLASRRLCALVLPLLLAACGAPDGSATAAGVAPPYPSSAGPFDVGPDSVTVLYRGLVAFPEIHRLLLTAVHRVDVEMYEVQRPDLVADLISAARRGLAVRVITDPSVDASMVSAARLRSTGVEVVLYPVRRLMIDHVKLVVVDGSVAVAGGINWGAASARHHDVDLLVRGPAAANLERVFLRDLVTAARPALVPTEVPDTAVRVVSTLPAPAIRPLVRAIIDAAVSRLDLQLYVLTDLGLVHALERAASRGVRLRVLLDPTERPSDAAAAELRAHGVPVRLYRGHGELLHAKTMVADGRTVVAGSANWSSGGFSRNHELDLVLEDAPAVAAVFTQAADSDWASAADGGLWGSAPGDAEAA